MVSSLQEESLRGAFCLTDDIPSFHSSGCICWQSPTNLLQCFPQGRARQRISRPLPHLVDRQAAAVKVHLPSDRTTKTPLSRISTLLRATAR